MVSIEKSDEEIIGSQDGKTRRFVRTQSTKQQDSSDDIEFLARRGKHHIAAQIDWQVTGHGF